jgi:hypothetical protein
LRASDASQAVVDLRRKFADVSNEEVDGPRKKTRAGNGDSENEIDPKKEIEDLGRKYVILCGLWLRKGRKTFLTNVDEDYSSLAQHRFQNTKSKVQGQLADIRELIPARYHVEDAFKGGWVSKTVSSLFS